MILILYIMPNLLAGILNRISCSMLRSIDIEVTLKGTEGKIFTQGNIASTRPRDTTSDDQKYRVHKGYIPE